MPSRLARHVLDPRGQVLLGRGSVIDESTAEALRRSVACVWIESEPGEADRPPDSRARRTDQRRAERIETMYSAHRGNERMEILRRLSISHVLGRPAVGEDGMP